MLITKWDMLETNVYKGGGVWFHLPHWAGLAACSTALDSVSWEGGTAKNWGGLVPGGGCLGNRKLGCYSLMGASGSQAHVQPLMCHSNARGPSLITALWTLMSLLYFQPLSDWLTFLSKHANSDPLGWPVSDRQIGELSTLAGSENVKETKEQTSKPMTRKD